MSKIPLNRAQVQGKGVWFFQGREMSLIQRLPAVPTKANYGGSKGDIFVILLDGAGGTYVDLS